MLTSFSQMISDLDEMMVERLQLWQKRNNNLLPERVFMFRDGVSEVRLAYSLVYYRPPTHIRVNLKRYCVKNSRKCGRLLTKYMEPGRSLRSRSPSAGNATMRDSIL